MTPRQTLPQKRRALGEIMSKQQGCCYLCSEPMTMDWGHPNTATREHALPLTRGGDDQGIRAACWSCNNLKGQRTEAEFWAAHPNLASIRAAKDARWPVFRPPLPLALPQHILDRIHAAGLRLCRPVEVGLSRPDWQPVEVEAETCALAGLSPRQADNHPSSEAES